MRFDEAGFVYWFSLSYSVSMGASDVTGMMGIQSVHGGEVSQASAMADTGQESERSVLKTHIDQPTQELVGVPQEVFVHHPWFPGVEESDLMFPYFPTQKQSRSCQRVMTALSEQPAETPRSELIHGQIKNVMDLLKGLAATPAVTARLPRPASFVLFDARKRPEVTTKQQFTVKPVPPAAEWFQSRDAIVLLRQISARWYFCRTSFHVDLVLLALPLLFF